MIKPIQQGVVFKGAKAPKADNFKGGGNKAVNSDVRAGYNFAINNVLKIQQQANELSKEGTKLNRIV